MRATQLKQDSLKTKDSSELKGMGIWQAQSPDFGAHTQRLHCQPLKMKAQETAACRKPRAPRKDNKFPRSRSVNLKFLSYSTHS